MKTIKANQIRATRDKPAGAPATSDPTRTREQLVSSAAIDGVLGNAMTALTFGKALFGEMTLNDSALTISDAARTLDQGDMSPAIRMLVAQAVALNSMFGELARVGQDNMFTAPEHAERYLKLAFKAQTQSRATFETLAAIKNPPVVFAKQMNVSNGPQQVNNGTASPGKQEQARTEEKPFQQNELIEALTDDRTQMDTRTAPATSRKNPELVPMEAINRAAHRQR